jgi:hypothetical protein
MEDKIIEMKEEGNKLDSHKVRIELLPPFALEKIAEVFTFGAKKYSEWNWAKGLKYSRIYGALLRHLFLWYKGENLDKETGKSHLYHAGCCVMMLIETEEFRKDLDDRPIHYNKNKGIEELIKENPNDTELGTKIRQIYGQ